jgi:hypothetical protein
MVKPHLSNEYLIIRAPLFGAFRVPQRGEYKYNELRLYLNWISRYSRIDTNEFSAKENNL